MNNSHYSPVTEVYFEGHSMCSLVECFPVTLYAHSVLSQIAKICPLLKSLGSKLVSLSFIVIWIWMCFLDCSPCCHWVTWGLCAVVYLVTFGAFLGCPEEQSADAYPVLSMQKHLLTVPIFQDERFAKAQVVWSVLAESRNPQLAAQLKVWGETQLLWVTPLTIIQDSQKMCWMSWWAFCSAQISSKRCRVNSTVPN